MKTPAGRSCCGVPAFDSFDAVVINSSAGKDSQTALRQVILLMDEHAAQRSKAVLSHQDLGRLEWPGTKELASEHAAHYGIRFEVSQYRSKHGTPDDLLAYVRRRWKWPDARNRFCTSEFKRGPGGRVLTKLAREARAAGIARPRLLNVYGFRAAESPARAKKQVFSPNKRFNRPSAEVWDWLPIHDWTEAEVWADIAASGVRYHPAYDLGMPRLSCSFCIFAPRAALIVAGRARPDLLDEYVQVEKEIEHTFRHKLSLREIREAVQQEEQVDAGELHGSWNM